MSEEPGNSDPVGRRPEGSASGLPHDEFVLEGQDRARFGTGARRRSGRNEIRWSLDPRGYPDGEIVARLRELRDPGAGQAGPARYDGPVSTGGQPAGWQFFRAGLADLFPAGTSVDWQSWAALEDAIVDQVRRGREVTLAARAVAGRSGPPQLALRINISDPRTRRTVDYGYAPLAEHARGTGQWGPAAPAAESTWGAYLSGEYGASEPPPWLPPRPAHAPGQGVAQPGMPAGRQAPGPVVPPPDARAAYSPDRSVPYATGQPAQTGPYATGQPSGLPAGQPPDPRVGVAQAVGATATPGRQPGPVQGPQVGPAQTQPIAMAQDVEFARGVLGTSFGVLAPSAQPLADGGVRLTDAGDVLTRDDVDRVTTELAQLAAAQASGPRLLAEAVARVGATTALAAGEHPADGATVALDTLLDIPFLPEQNRVEAEAVLQEVLAGRSHAAPAAGEQGALGRRATVSGIVGGAEEIGRDAQVLQAGSPAARPGTNGPRPQVGRNRPAAGRHRQLEPSAVVEQVMAGAGLVQASDLGGRGSANPIQRTGPRTAVVALEGREPQHFLLEPGSALRRRTSVDARTGTPDDPHVLHLPSSVPGGDPGPVWVRACADVAQQQASDGTGVRSTGPLGLTRSSQPRTRRDRKVAAKYAEHRLLSRNWQELTGYVAQYGAFDDGRRQRDLERQLNGLSGGIERLGYGRPLAPWESGPIQVNAVPVPTGAVVSAAGPRPSELAHLRQRVITEIESLEQSAEYLRQCAQYKTSTAAQAGDLATSHRKDQKKHAAHRDDGASERARKRKVAAEAADGIQRRHKVIATAYRTAAQRADGAKQGFQSMLAELDALAADPNRSTDRLAALAADAGQLVTAYGAGVAATQPSDLVLPSAVPVGRLPFMTTVTDEVSKGLRAHGVRDEQLLPGREQLHWLCRSEFGLLVSEQGLVRSIGGPVVDATQMPQYRLRLRLPDRTEEFGPLDTHSEMIVGQLDQRSETLTTTVAKSRAYKGRLGLRPILNLIPGVGAVQAAARFVGQMAPTVETEDKRTGTRSAKMATGGRRASVEDIRGEAVAFSCAQPVWVLQFRSSPYEPWSDPVTVSSGPAEDAQSLLLRMSHAYTVPAPARTTDIVREGFKDQRVDTMPEHMATYVGGMNDLADQAAVQLRDTFGDLSSVAYGELNSLINEWPGRLDEATKPGGFYRPIIENGVEIGTIQAETELVWETIELEGEPSADHWVERVRVGLATSGIGNTAAVSAKTGVGVGYGGRKLKDVGDTKLDRGLKGSRSVAKERGLSSNAVKYEVGVERAKQTQGYRLKAKHVLTVHKHERGKGTEADRRTPIRVRSSGDVLLRMPEANAFRYGFPVAPEAVVRDEQGRPRTHPKTGKILLRGDAQPRQELPPLPAWWGDDVVNRQLAGKGTAQVPLITGLEERLREVMTGLQREGLIPPLDDNLQARLEELPGNYDNVLLGCQLRNLDRVRQAMSGVRAGPNYDELTTGVMTVPLEWANKDLVHSPQTHVLEINLKQRFETAQVLGVSTAETPLYLDIRSVTSTESLNSSTTHRGDGSVGLKGLTNGIGIGGNLSGGSTAGTAAGVTGNVVTLREGTEEAVLASVMHSGSVRLWSPGGAKHLASVEGETLVMFEGEQCKPAPANEFWSARGVLDDRIVDRAQLLHLDLRNPLDTIWAALPPATQEDPAARLQLAAFLDVRNLTSDPDWIGKVRRTHLVSPAPSSPGLAMRQGGIAPSNVTVELRARVVDLEHLSSASPVTGDIGLTLRSNTRTDARQTSRGVTGPGSVGADAGALLGAKGELGRTTTDSRSESHATIGGSEGLGIETGVQDTFRARVVLEAVVKADGREPVTVPLNDGAALYSIPERQLVRLYGQRLLDLPVERTANAIERVLNENLALDRRTATGLVRRYKEDRAGVTEGLAGQHTLDDLHHVMQVVTDLKPRSTEPRVTGTTEQGLDAVVSKAEAMQDHRVEVELPEHFEDMMAESLIQDWASVDDLGNDTEPVDQVKRLIAEKVPGAFGADPTIDEALTGDLAGDRWIGHRDDIFSPGGWERDYTVKTSELGPPERVRVRIIGEFTGKPTTDGTPELPEPTATNIQQLYLYVNDSQTRSKKVDYAGSIGFGGTSLGGYGVSGTIGTHRVRSLGATNSRTLTWMSRIAHSRTAEVERGYRLLVHVERLPSPETRSRLRRITDRVRTQPPPEPPAQAFLHGRMTQLVPSQYANAPTPLAARADNPDRQVDHRAVQMPGEPYWVGAVRPHLSTEKKQNALFEAVQGRLGDSDLLTPAGVAAHHSDLKTHLSPGRLQSAFKLFISDGYRISDMDVPGHRRKVSAVVNLKPYDLELIAGPVEGVELGEVFRSEVVSQSTVTGNRLLSTNKTVEGGTPSLGIGVSTGEQVTDTHTDLTGSRGERSRFIKPENAVVVRVRYDADVTYQRRGLFRRSKHKTIGKDRSVAKGEAYVTMSERDYNAMRERMESQAALPQTPEPGTKTVTMERHDHDYDEQGQWRPQPYKPLVEALAVARSEGVVVALTVHRQNGPAQFYQAYPNGVLTANDGGFAEAFSTLHPSLARLAEGKVDLQDLHQRHGGQRFTHTVAAALRQAKVEPSVIAEAAHSVIPGHIPKHLAHREDGGYAHDDGARPTLSSGTTPGAAAGGLSV